MLHAVMIAAAISASHQSSLPKTATQQCLATMDGALYHGDPSDLRLMKTNVAVCAKSVAEMNAILPASAAEGPEKLFILGRVLDRTATLSYMGLKEVPTALHDATIANLYFRIAAGLPDQTALYHEAALANVKLTTMQLQTLKAEPAMAGRATIQRTTAYHKE